MCEPLFWVIGAGCSPIFEEDLDSAFFCSCLTAADLEADSPFFFKTLDGFFGGETFFEDCLEAFEEAALTAFLAETDLTAFLPEDAFTEGLADFFDGAFETFGAGFFFETGFFSGFLDGGTLDNVPVIPLKQIYNKKIMAVNFESDKVEQNSDVMDIVMKTLDIMGNKIAENGLKQSDLTITVPTDGTGLFDIEKLDKCYQFGYDTVIKNLDKIKKVAK